ncbi:MULTISPECIES: hypothetical protein [Streptomyces]|uniref:Secreted protein n=1 Tax=Streptomyces fimbriatus TaxID=68197 RepID=A0ABW0DAM2_STRFI
MIVSLVYRVVRKLLAVPAVLLCRNMAKDAELLVLRHENVALAENLIRRGGSRCAGCAGSRARTLESVLSRDWRSPWRDGWSCCCDWLT